MTLNKGALKVDEKNGIYECLSRKIKIEIGKEVNQLCREYVFKNGWDNVYDEDVIESLVNTLSKNGRYSIYTSAVFRGIKDEDSINEFKEFLHNKIVEAFKKFGTQNATPRQIYYYIQLCEEVGERHRVLTINKEIHTEIDRLLELRDKKKKENKLI